MRASFAPLARSLAPLRSQASHAHRAGSNGARALSAHVQSSQEDHNRAAQVLRASRLIPAKPVNLPVSSLEEAYKIHCEIAASCKGNRAGWKVGASNAAAIAKLGLSECFRGPLFNQTVRSSPAKVAWEELGVALFAVEAEFAFKMQSPLPPRPEPYTEEEVWEAVGSVHPAIEVAASRSPGALPLSPQTISTIVADFALHGVLVLGEGVDARRVDVRGLADVEAEISRVGADGAAASNKGKGGNVLEHPIKSLTWLVNALRKDNIPLEQGQIVSTGAATLLTSDQVPWGKECTLEMRMGPLYTGAEPMTIRLNLPSESVRPWQIIE